MLDIIKEKPNLNADDLFSLFHYHQAKFDYPLHNHEEFELNFVLNTSGQRIVGDSKESFEDMDLVLLGSNLPHFWKAPTHQNTEVITIYFSKEILHSFIMNKKSFLTVKEMLMKANRGIKFSQSTIQTIRQQMFELRHLEGFDSALGFLSILATLSASANQQLLASPTYDVDSLHAEYKSRRIEYVCKYINENYHKPISLKSMSTDIGMCETSFSHFFKKRTSRNFITYINEVRIGQASKMLMETTNSVSEISYMCGFNNLSNFNRMFKKYKKQTPGDYRKSAKELYMKNLVNMLQ